LPDADAWLPAAADAGWALAAADAAAVDGLAEAVGEALLGAAAEPPQAVSAATNTKTVTPRKFHEVVKLKSPEPKMARMIHPGNCASSASS
jgi:hypothetical protein